MPVETKILVIEPEGPDDWYAPLKELGRLDLVVPGDSSRSHETAKLAADASAVIITSSCGFTAEDLEQLPRLKIIAKCGGKPSNVDIDAATKKGIAVTYVPGANSTTVAEFAVMLILDGLRRFPFISSSISKGLNRNTTDMFGRELRGKTIGIVGYGAIGQEVAKRLAGFDCHSLVFDPFYKRSGSEPDCVEFADNLDALLPRIDVLTLHCTLNDSTRGLISEKALGLMKPNAGIVNTARAQIIDEIAMERAIRSGRISFAALDVFTTEPPGPDHPLLGLENVILTPHLSSWTPEALYREVHGAIESVIACLKEEAIPGLINPAFEKFRRPL